jgi:hypothetical protein
VPIELFKKLMNGSKKKTVPRFVHISLYIMLSLFYNFLSWRNTYFPAEEASQFFPRAAINAIFEDSYFYNGSPLDGNSLNAIPIGLITSFFTDKVSTSILILATQIILNLLINVSSYFLFSIFIQNQKWRFLALICLQFSFVITNFSSYFSKSLSLIFFCFVFYLFQKEMRIRSIFIATVALNFLCVGMLSNLGALFVAWLSFPVAFWVFSKKVSSRNRRLVKILVMLGVSVSFQFPILYRFYLSNNLLSEYAAFSDRTELRFGSNFHLLTGDGNWLQFGSYGETFYYNYILGEDHWTYLARLLIVISILGYIFLTSIFVARNFHYLANSARENTHHLTHPVGRLTLIILLLGGFIIIPFDDSLMLESLIRDLNLTAFRDPWMKFGGVFFVLFISVMFSSLERIFQDLDNLERALRDKNLKSRFRIKSKAKFRFLISRIVYLRIIGVTLVLLQVFLTPLTNFHHQVTFQGPLRPVIDVQSPDFELHKREALTAAARWMGIAKMGLGKQEILCLLAKDNVTQSSSKTLLLHSFESVRKSHESFIPIIPPAEYLNLCSGQLNDLESDELNCDYSSKFIQVVSRLCYRQVSKVT